MRLSNFFGASASEPAGDAAGVTIDVMTGIVAGIAFVLAVLILASSLRSHHGGPMPANMGQATQSEFKAL
jgi:hypothetical protein